MLDLMQQQMTQLNNLQAENIRLRTVADEVAANNNVAANDNEHNQYKAKKPDRPTINAGLDDREWALFNDTWARYKAMINVVEEASVRMELRAACSDDVNKLLFEFVGPTTLDACTEDELLGHIKSVAVKSVHKEVHQVAFNKMVQNPGESVTNYVARLKAKAFLCEFEVLCTHHGEPIQVSYAEQMVSQRLMAGLANHEHQRKILAEAPTLTTLDEKVARLQMLETTEESVTFLNKPPPSEAAIQRSTYKQGKDQRGPSNRNEDVATKCRWCGRTSHPEGKPMDRVNCPAYKKECNKCHTKGHFGVVCEKSRNDVAQSNQQNRDSDNQLPLESLPSEASVSFAFSAQDFCLARGHDENT